MPILERLIPGSAGNETLPILLAAFLASVCLFLVLYGAFREAGRAYRERVIADVRQGLHTQFVEARPITLLYMSLLLALVLAAMVSLIISPVLAPFGAGVGLAAPKGILTYVRNRRCQRFIHQMPDALQSMASSLRAGANLSKALELMATRQPAPLNEEFGLLLAKQRLGSDLSTTLRELRNRIPANEVDLFNSAVLTSRQVGGDLAGTLDSLASAMREKAEVEDKIKSLTAMGRMQGWVMCFLPILVGGMLYLQQPGKMQQLFTEWFGLLVVVVVGLMMAMAIWMIRRIVNIDV